MKKKPVVTKSFRLFDFYTYDGEISDTSNSEESSNDEHSVDGNPQFNANKTNTFLIQMFGINEKGDSCCLFVKDYLPFFFIKVADHWDKYIVKKFMLDLKNRSHHEYKDPRFLSKTVYSNIVSCELVEHEKLYGFSGGKQHKFMKMSFTNFTSMNKVKKLWYKYIHNFKGEFVKKVLQNIEFNNTSLELYESNLLPLLRCFHIYNISPSGWVAFKLNQTSKPSVKTTTCKYEYIISINNILPENDKEVIVPYKICSYDIEASSSHGDFPVPKKDYKRLATNIVDIFLPKIGIPVSQKQLDKFLELAILTAFGHGKLKDIDIVYPKKNVTVDDLKERIAIVLSHAFNTAKTMNTKEDNTELIKINDIIEQMNQFNQTMYENNDDNEDQDCDIVDKPRFKYKNTINIDRKDKLIQILLSEALKRDEKIQLTNEILTRLFPPLEGDKVTFIGSTFLNYGKKEPYLNHCAVLGSCDPIDGCEIETCDTEREVLLKWTELIQREDPDIIIGYNIFGFDYSFMFNRADELYCLEEFLLLSRIKDEVAANEVNNQYEMEKTLLKIASGEYDLQYYKMKGRLQIDMYAYFRRDFNLSSYKLDDVAGQFISDSIKKVEVVEHPIHGKCTELYSKNLMGLHQGDFIHIELNGFTSDYYGGGKKFRVLEIVEDKDGFNVIMIKDILMLEDFKSIKWTMAKDDVTPQDIFRLANGDSADRAIVAKYCVQDCNLVHHLMNKIDVITGFIEMSRICSVPINFLIFRGQGIKLTSYVAKKCREKNTLMPDMDKSEDKDGYEGAIVLPPKCSMYMDNPVACVDYSSLYPSSMISQNYSHDSKVWTKEYDLQGNLFKETGETDGKGNYIYDNLPEFQYIDIEFDSYKYVRKTETSKEEKVISGKKICRWAQLPDNQRSVMPSILTELLKARKDTRNMIKTEKDPFIQNILDKRQLGYKVTANSLYGQCGSKTSTFYEKDVAASTTATGRMMILYAKKMVETVYGNAICNTKAHGQVRTRAEYVYGDTDSVFYTFNLEDPVTGEKIRGQPALEITIELSYEVEKISSMWLKAPMYLEYEKTLMPFMLLSKKRYVGMLYEEDPNKGYLKYMGLSLKRRDSCDYLKDIYGGILNILMKENNLSKSIDFLNTSLNNLIQGKVPMDKLAITKALRSDYKNPHQIGHKVLADRIGEREPGNKPKPGDRIKFVFICTDKPKALMGDKIETPQFIISNDIKIDYNHYITNQIMKPLQQLYGLALPHIYEMTNLKGSLKTYYTEIDKLKHNYVDLEEFNKKKEKYCSTKIKSILFDKYLQQIYNEKNNIQTITQFFKSR
jgi:DNA polymerase elongation subunit (family B)|uniref:DNA-directed DNA polymerase n=1 Tax=viral metagenome TaxID=1070528 RepID=A0A6C0IPB5_9ZZZZ